MMDSVSRSAVTPTKSRLARTIAKVLHLRGATGIAPVDGIQKGNSQEIGIQKINYQEIGIQKAKSQEIGIQKVKSKELGNQKFKSQEIGIQKVQDDRNAPKVRVTLSQSFEKNNEKLQERAALEALLAKLFASISSVKASYAQLQYAQTPYDADGIRAADHTVVDELKNLSELKRCFLKKEFDPSPETTLVLAEIEEQKSVLKTYDIMGKKLESQVRLKDSEVIFLGEKLEEANKLNKLLEKRVYQSGQLYVPDNLHLSGLSPSHFITVLRHTVRSIRSFVRAMMDEMKSAGWDIHTAANSIDGGEVVYWKEDHKCFAFEQFVCREMFDGFQYPNFSLPNEFLPEKKKQQQQLFFEAAHLFYHPSLQQLTLSFNQFTSLQILKSILRLPGDGNGGDTVRLSDARLDVASSVKDLREQQIINRRSGGETQKRSRELGIKGEGKRPRKEMNAVGGERDKKEKKVGAWERER